jgi:hypothetical protein
MNLDLIKTRGDEQCPPHSVEVSWRRHVLPGRPEVALTLACEVGYDNVQIQIESDEMVGLRDEAAMQIMMRSSLRERRV